MTQPKMSKMSKSVVDRAAQYRHLRTLYNSSSDDQTEMALEDALVEQEKLLADFQLYKEGRNGRSEAEWTALSQSERVKEWLTLENVAELHQFFRGATAWASWQRAQLDAEASTAAFR